MNVEILSEKIFPVLELEQQLVFLLKRSSLATQHEQQDEEKKITAFHDTDDTKMAQSTLQQRIQEVNAYLTPSTSSSRDTTATTTTTTTTIIPLLVWERRSTVEKDRPGWGGKGSCLPVLPPVQK